MVEKRAIREFRVGSDPWPVVEQWAAQQGYRAGEQADGHRVYKKGAGVMTGARVLELDKAGDQLHMEAYVTANTLARLSSLFILPKEMTVESGAKGVLPRKLGRNEVNHLLEAFGQAPLS
jgi:hypothetical protein